MTDQTARSQSVAPLLAIATSFVAARRAGRAVPGFPGDVPTTLERGYEIQELAIGLWGDAIVGWKVGKVPDELVAGLGQTRVVGPIFRGGLWQADAAGRNGAPVFVGGFAAVEAEFVFELLEDAPPGKHDWSLAEVRRLKGRMRIGVEMAGSPLATINVLGPPAVASDFGNNNGLILGEPLADWGEFADAAYVCETYVDGELVGRGSAASVPGGPMESVRFLLEHVARRGRPLQAGQLVSTGAATGIHDITVGQSGRVSFGRYGAIGCHAVAATAEGPAA